MKTDKKTQTRNTNLFLDFINTEGIDKLSATELGMFAMKYFDLLEAFRDKMPFIGNEILSKKRSDTIVLINSTDEKSIKEVVGIFEKLQQKTKKYLKTVVEATGINDEDITVLSSSGTYKVSTSLSEDRFTAFFTPEGDFTTLSYTPESQLLKIVMESILVGYNKKPSSLKTCEKNGCSNLFFKYNQRSKFCSTKCSNAASQQAHRKRAKQS
jgi:predicted RNA-binding Zn ribbon-like protein